ncbi:MAG: dihydroorotase [Flavobacteriales bacterium]|nr:dihydroorotase [Flavobacteriia bacterium]NCP05612.1 dihydroorotase [Flavobacteriales bacterium]PIV94682.1 MAG: dihydroorotase [Flavobacteriaceae bacterium CG17_big_fil_post_rev_8_21_14_2_50_33_15]PIY10854.1 MAG: dihydroorotase [Flavobacteriaceae bacterium CG_4_10_14_3_um_filter_33_47]PJB20555.1 MAG: dihydroorotase [Flavobacteriaceae bacterium CG_4_9_14_3_um_filter_33_16]
MNILIKSAKIIDSKSEFHNTIQDLLIEKGVISQIGIHLKNPKKYQEISFKNLHVSQGWFDSSVCFGEPGFEDRETIKNGLKTAASSGFTAVAMNANTHPIIDSNSDITFVNSKAEHHAVKLLPVGALTKDSNGVDLAELYDMKSAGAVAFYDYKKSVANPNLMKLALQYTSNFNGLVCSFPQDNKISGLGVMNENITSTSLGLKGNPTLSEELQVARDLFLLEYTHGKLHIPTISTADSVALIRQAKKKKLDVSCSVAIHNLCFTDKVLTDFDTAYKVLPPLRTQEDIDALLEGIKDGTIDMVTSDHNPMDIEHKKVEFDHAAYGTIGLESAFGALQTIFTLKKTIELLTKGKSRFGLEKHSINIGNKLDITLFNPDIKYTFSLNDVVSKSKNAIFENQALKGKVYGIISNNQLFLN